MCAYEHYFSFNLLIFFMCQLDLNFMDYVSEKILMNFFHKRELQTQISFYQGTELSFREYGN